MIKNNYNTSTEENDIEIACFMDSCASQFEIEFDFNVLQYAGPKDLLLLSYGCELEETASPADLYDWGNVTRKGARAFCLESSFLEPKDCIRERIEEHDSWQDMAQYMLNDMSWNDIARHDIPAGDGMQPNFRMIHVTGYSQGDYAYILLFNKVEHCLNEHKHFERLIYGAPVYLCVEIDGKEHLYPDMVEDCYEWEPEKVLEYFKRKEGISSYALEYIKKNLPSQPSWD